MHWEHVFSSMNDAHDPVHADVSLFKDVIVDDRGLINKILYWFINIQIHANILGFSTKTPWNGKRRKRTTEAAGMRPKRGSVHSRRMLGVQPREARGQARA